MRLGNVIAISTFVVFMGMCRWGARYLMAKDRTVESRRSLRRIWVWGGIGRFLEFGFNLI
jgi:hypothetical protein